MTTSEEEEKYVSPNLRVAQSKAHRTSVPYSRRLHQIGPREIQHWKRNQKAEIEPKA